MGLILCIETATTVCSVALSREGNVFYSRLSTGRNAHSSLLTTFIEEIIREAGMEFSRLDAIAVSSGPGSYTGLRIGVATAKGLCYALDKPLISVPTLKAMALGMRAQYVPATGKADAKPLLFCPLIDARRMEIYRAFYDENLEEVLPTAAEIIDENSFVTLLDGHTVIFGGEGAAKCQPVLGAHPDSRFMIGFEASAAWMAPLAEERFLAGHYENLAYYEPFYLKDFIAGKPRVKGLH